LMSAIGVLIVSAFYVQSVPGAQVAHIGRATLDPVTQLQFVAMTVLVVTCVIVFSLPIWAPVELKIDEAGIRKTMGDKGNFWPWCNIRDIEVSERGGFRGRGGTIRFVLSEEPPVRPPVDLSPGMFNLSAAALSALIREGLFRWGDRA